MNRKKNRGQTPDPEEVMAAIIAACRVRPMNSERFYAFGIGLLAFAKLALRLDSGGEARFSGDPKAWDMLEAESDKLAEKYFDAVQRDTGITAAHGIRGSGEREYLRLVKDGRYRWSKIHLNPDDLLPDEIDVPALRRSAHVTQQLVFRLLDVVGERRSKATRDVEARRFEQIAQIIAFMALSKLVLALTGNGTVSAVLEELADKLSEAEYTSLQRHFRHAPRDTKL